MPSVHHDFTIVSRSEGHRAISASAYASRTRLYDPITEKFVDYSNHSDKCLHSEILLPEKAPKSYSVPETLWLEVEKSEKRIDSQLARKLIVGLPHELAHAERIDLMRGYIQDQFISKGMIAEFAIHEPHKDGDQRNFHGHVLLTMRQVNECGFWTSKTREWNTKPQLLEWRNQWFNAQNRAYARAGLDIRIDPRTLKIQHIEAVKNGDIKRALELDRQPEIHIGRKEWTGSENRYRHNLAITQNNYQRMDDISQILRASDAQNKQIQRYHFKRRQREENQKWSTAIYQWELSKAIWGDLKAYERGSGYWQSLKNLIDLIPLENRDGRFEIPKFDRLQPIQKSKPLPPKFANLNPPDKNPASWLNDLFNQHGGHLSLPEKISLASAFADMTLNIRAGRNAQMAKHDLKRHSHKIHKKAWKRQQARERARFRSNWKKLR